MSTQSNQFFIYGIQLPYSFHEKYEEETGVEDFYEHFEDFADETAFKSDVNHKDGICMLFDGRDGEYIIIGRVLAKSRNGEFLDGPIGMPKFTDLEIELLQDSIERNFGIREKLEPIFVTHYR